MSDPPSSDVTPVDPRPPAALHIDAAALQRAAPRFDLAALLDVLALLGYRGDQLLFRSHLSTAHQPALIHAIELLQDPPRARITLNLGLLSAQGPLPSYFLKVMSQQRGESLEEFLGFFDHWLLRDLVLSQFPERTTTLFPNFAQTRQQLLQIMARKAPSTLHWLFQRAFPELRVHAQRVIQRRTLRTSGIRMGATVLGEGSTFGGETAIPSGGVEVVLLTEEARSATDEPWGVEVQRRFTTALLPILRGTGLLLQVRLVIDERLGWAQLREDRHLGYDPMGAPPEGAPQPQSILIFSGEIL